MSCVLVIGSTSDIGNALAKKFLTNGFNVILAAKDTVLLNNQKEELVMSFPKRDIQIAPFNGDQFHSHLSFYNGLHKQPDGVITVMGYLGEQKVSELSLKESMNVINVNYVGNVSILNVIANDFEKRGSGFIIGVSSVAGDRGRQSNYIYGSAKAGFTSYLSGLRNRLFGKGVSVLTVCPGFIETKMTQHLKLPSLLTSSPAFVAEAIYNAHQKKKDIIYIKPIWRFIMMVICLIPEPIFKRLKL